VVPGGSHIAVMVTSRSLSCSAAPYGILSNPRSIGSIRNSDTKTMCLAIGLKDSITRLFKGERKEICWLEAHSDEGLGRRTARRLSENGHFPQSLRQAHPALRDSKYSMYSSG